MPRGDFEVARNSFCSGCIHLQDNSWCEIFLKQVPKYVYNCTERDAGDLIDGWEERVEWMKERMEKNKKVKKMKL